MPGTSPTYLLALALSGRPAQRLAAEDVSLRPFCRSLLFLVALSLPVLASAIADRFHGDSATRTVEALAVPHSPLGGAARQPDLIPARVNAHAIPAAAR